MNTHQSDALYLGIDGGGSTCRARVQDRHGRVLGTGIAGPANLQLGLDTVMEQVFACTHAALSQAGKADYPVSTLHAGLGLAGAVLPQNLKDAEAFRQFFASCKINTDAYTACLGAHLGAPGAVVIVGTGSCAQVITPTMSKTYGGWGLALSDQASGAWLGQLALRETMLAMEAMSPRSALSDHIAAKFDHSPARVLSWSQTAGPADYAKFAPLVFSQAEQGDAQACALIEKGCDQLEKLILAVEQYNTGGICLLGGLSEKYIKHLPETLTASLCSARADALDGALLMAGLPLDALEPA